MALRIGDVRSVADDGEEDVAPAENAAQERVVRGVVRLPIEDQIEPRHGKHAEGGGQVGERAEGGVGVDEHLVVRVEDEARGEGVHESRGEQYAIDDVDYGDHEGRLLSGVAPGVDGGKRERGREGEVCGSQDEDPVVEVEQPADAVGGIVESEAEEREDGDRRQRAEDHEGRRAAADVCAQLRRVADAAAEELPPVAAVED
mmetsp:Transcript_40931/g.101751  ORF Transcript_40931/g.101751 Transcript_40931/m.101751 type:complete len:202 (-) Transcript_40931:110-715(-)